MKAWIPLLLISSLALAAAQAHATCTYPTAPATPPDGATATKDQMIEAKHDFDRYNGEMNAYLECLKLEKNASMPDTSKMSGDEKKKAEAAAKQQDQVLAQKNNAAVDELQANVGKFNEQLKIFKAKQKS
jgi:Skp family chaperone for outer membrane proteins